MDLSAEDIYAIHLNHGLAGIGYHYVIRNNDTIGQEDWEYLPVFTQRTITTNLSAFT